MNDTWPRSWRLGKAEELCASPTRRAENLEPGVARLQRLRQPLLTPSTCEQVRLRLSGPGLEPTNPGPEEMQLPSRGLLTSRPVHPAPSSASVFDGRAL